MIKIVIVGIRVDVAQRQTVHLGVGECPDDLRLEVLLVFMISIKGLLEVVGHFVIERLRKQPFH